MSAPESIKADKSDQPKSSVRRAALVKLGLAAGAVYLAPTILKLDGAAVARKHKRGHKK